jgi:hypothetical protein
MKDEKKRYKFFKAGAVTTIVIIAVALIMISEVGFREPIEHDITTKEIEQKREIVQITGDPAAGESGLFYGLVVPHAANPYTTFASNYTGTFYEIVTSGNSAWANTTPTATSFDWLYKVGFNASDANNGTAWRADYIWALMNCTGDISFSNHNLTELQIATAGNTYAWYHYWDNNSGSGYTVAENQGFNNTLRVYGYRIVG